MKVLILTLCLLPLNYAISGIELLAGANIGSISFESETPTENSFKGNSVGLQGTARGTLTTGRLQIGVGITMAQGKSKLDDFNSEYEHLFYGPVFGYIVSPSFRIDIEYYTDSTIEFTGGQSNVFNEGDKIFGNGVGMGLSLLRGHLVTQILYQRFSPSRIEISDVEYSAESDEASQFSIHNITLQIGILF